MNISVKLHVIPGKHMKETWEICLRGVCVSAFQHLENCKQEQEY